MLSLAGNPLVSEVIPGLEPEEIAAADMEHQRMGVLARKARQADRAAAEKQRKTDRAGGRADRLAYAQQAADMAGEF